MVIETKWGDYITYVKGFRLGRRRTKRRISRIRRYFEVSEKIKKSKKFARRIRGFCSSGQILKCHCHNLSKTRYWRLPQGSDICSKAKIVHWAEIRNFDFESLKYDFDDANEKINFFDFGPKCNDRL